MGTSSAELFLALDRSRPRGLRAQIEDGLRAAIRSGRLPPGARVPSTRALADDLGVTRRVVVEAYDQLTAEGYLLSRQGSSTTVNPLRASTTVNPPGGPSTADRRRGLSRAGARDQPVRRRAAAATVAGFDLLPGRPDPALFPRAAWARAARAALPGVDLSAGDPCGLPVLRRALADYLARVRGVDADPEQVVVTAGFGHGFSVVAEVLAGRGPVAVEDPGYPGPREQLLAVGASTAAVAVDAEGVVVEGLRRTDARVVVVTPAHQSPTGVVLAADRRQQLVDWARDVDGFVVEDDYDAEYRYDRRPVGALQGIAPERVIYAGTTSKTLAPGLRLGWLVVPPELVEPIAAVRRRTDGAVSAILQSAFAAFVTAGDLDRHLRRSRRSYRQRRDAALEAVARSLPEAVPSGVSAGLNVLLTFPGGLDEDGAVRRARARGVQLLGLSAFRATPAVPEEAPGLVLGYGSLPADRAARAVELLADAVRNGSGDFTS